MLGGILSIKWRGTLVGRRRGLENRRAVRLCEFESHPRRYLKEVMNMTTHNRGYYREQRNKHIRRKKRIIHMLNDYWHFEYEGVLSKGKIHCSCGMCMGKTRNKNYSRRHIHGNYAPSINYKPSDLRKIQSMNEQLIDFI